MSARKDPTERFEVLAADGLRRDLPNNARRCTATATGRAIHVWVLWVDQEGPYLVFQRRGAARHQALATRCNRGGHLRAGETVEQTLREGAGGDRPIGFAAAAPAIWRSHRVSEDEPGIIDRELQHVFLWRVDEPLSTFVPNPDELEGLVQLSLDDVLAIFGEGIVAADALELKAGSVILTPVLVTRSEFVSGLDRYPFRVAIAVRNALRGDRYIAV